MIHRRKKALQSWLRDEKAGRLAAADAALRRLFRALPLPAPPAGFVDRVMAAAGLAPQPAWRPVLAWRLVLTAGLALAGGAAAIAPALTGAVLRRLSPGDLIGLGAGAVVETCRRFAEGLAVWETLGFVGGTIAEALSAPEVLAALAATSLLSAGGLRVLHGLLAVNRSSEHVRL